MEGHCYISHPFWVDSFVRVLLKPMQAAVRVVPLPTHFTHLTVLLNFSPFIFGCKNGLVDRICPSPDCIPYLLYLPCHTKGWIAAVTVCFARHFVMVHAYLRIGDSIPKLPPTGWPATLHIYTPKIQRCNVIGLQRASFPLTDIWKGFDPGQADVTK